MVSSKSEAELRSHSFDDRLQAYGEVFTTICNVRIRSSFFFLRWKDDLAELYLSNLDMQQGDVEGLEIYVVLTKAGLSAPNAETSRQVVAQLVHSFFSFDPNQNPAMARARK